MTQQPSTKTCKVCYEQIDARARLCRYCGQPQQGPAAWLVRHLSVVAAFYLLAVVSIVLMMAFSSRRLWYRGEDFGPYREQIKVTSSHMVFEQTERGPIVCVVGKLRNDSELTWKAIELEVQFMDEAGKLMDTARHRQSFDASRVLPHDETGFKIKAPCDFPKDRYASHKVFVRYATDARSRW